MRHWRDCNNCRHYLKLSPGHCKIAMPAITKKVRAEIDEGRLKTEWRTTEMRLSGRCGKEAVYFQPVDGFNLD